MPPISGSFKGSSNYVGYRPSADLSRNWGTGVDVDHNRTDQPDPGFPGPAHPPYVQWVPPYIEDFFNPAADDLPYLPAREQEPKGHDVPGVPSGYIGDDESQAKNNQARSVNLGANTSVGRPTGQRSFGETNRSPLTESLPPARGEGEVTGQALRALRGRNSLAVNNPGSPEVNFSGNYVRQGRELSRLTNRPMPRTDLTHTKRALHLNLAETAGNRPGVESPYSSSVASTPVMSVGAVFPFMRRQPRQWDEDVVRDGTEVDYDETSDYQSWGL